MKLRKLGPALGLLMGLGLPPKAHAQGFVSDDPKDRAASIESWARAFPDAIGLSARIAGGLSQTAFKQYNPGLDPTAADAYYDASRPLWDHLKAVISEGTSSPRAQPLMAAVLADIRNIAATGVNTSSYDLNDLPGNDLPSLILRTAAAAANIYALGGVVPRTMVDEVLVGMEKQAGIPFRNVPAATYAMGPLIDRFLGASPQAVTHVLITGTRRNPGARARLEASFDSSVKAFVEAERIADALARPNARMDKIVP